MLKKCFYSNKVKNILRFELVKDKFVLLLFLKKVDPSKLLKSINSANAFMLFSSSVDIMLKKYIIVELCKCELIVSFNKPIVEFCISINKDGFRDFGEVLFVDVEVGLNMFEDICNFVERLFNKFFIIYQSGELLDVKKYVVEFNLDTLLNIKKITYDDVVKGRDSPLINSLFFVYMLVVDRVLDMLLPNIETFGSLIDLVSVF